MSPIMKLNILKVINNKYKIPLKSEFALIYFILTNQFNISAFDLNEKVNFFLNLS